MRAVDVCEKVKCYQLFPPASDSVPWALNTRSFCGPRIHLIQVQLAWEGFVGRLRSINNYCVGGSIKKGEKDQHFALIDVKVQKRYDLEALLANVQRQLTDHSCFTSSTPVILGLMSVELYMINISLFWLYAQARVLFFVNASSGFAW